MTDNASRNGSRIIQNGFVLQKGGDCEMWRMGRSGAEVVAASCVPIRKWWVVLWCRTMWHVGTDKMVGWCCVRSWGPVQMINRSMRNNSKVVDKLYIKRGCLLLEDFPFFSLYSCSSMTNRYTTFKQHRLMSCLELSIHNSNVPVSLPNFIIVTSITYTQPCPLHHVSFQHCGLTHFCSSTHLHLHQHSSNIPA